MDNYGKNIFGSKFLRILFETTLFNNPEGFHLIYSDCKVLGILDTCLFYSVVL